MSVDLPDTQPDVTGPASPSGPPHRRRARRPKGARSLRSTLIIAVLLLTPVMAIPAYGYYVTYVEPMQIRMVRVNDTLFVMGDYVDRMRFLEVESKAVGRRMDFGSDPFRLLDEMRDDELIRQGSPRMGIIASQDEVTAAAKERLAAVPREGEALTGEELERNFQELYKQHLAQINLSDEKFRTLTHVTVLRRKLRDALSDRVPSVAEHARVYGIKSDDLQKADDIKKRLEKGEDFATIARQASTDFDSQENRGDLGWMPRRGLERQLDEAAFKLDLNTTSDPVFVDRGFWIIRVTGREVREVEGKAKEKLKDRALLDWLEEERKQNLVETYFDSDRYAYVIDRVREYRRPSPSPSPSGPPQQ